jgi:hypothetical protein
MSPTLWFLALACTPDEEEVLVDLDASIAPSTHVPSVGHVSVSSSEGPTLAAGETFLEYGLDGDLSSRTPDGVLYLLGLKAGRSYGWRAVVLDADGIRHESAPGTFDVPLPPAELRELTVTVDEPEAEVRYLLGSVVRAPIDSYAVIFDRDGDYVWWAASGGAVMPAVELGIDGASVLWMESDFAKWDDVGEIERVSLDGMQRIQTRTRMAHHDLAQLEDGTLGFLGLTFEQIDIGASSVLMATDTISVVAEGATDADEPTLLFDQFRDFPLEPEVTCNHVSSQEDRMGQLDVAEWTHANSLAYLPETGAFYVNDKSTDWLFAVDAVTGDVRWILNGRGSDFTQPSGEPVWNAVDQTTLWSHGHMSEVWDGGGLMFDNGDHHPAQPTRALEYVYDEAAMTAEVVWSFDHPGGRKTPALGDVRRMPEANRMITWSGLGSLDEVTPDLRVVWEATYLGNTDSSDGQSIGRIVPIADLYEP